MLRKWAQVPLKIGRVIFFNKVKCSVKGGYMEIGNKMLELRKQNNLSQEQLAEKMGVARQTISKWELGETSPDLEQSKQLSQIFNVSLDDLTNNEIKNVLIKKVSNMEKMTKIIISILKIILLIIVICIIICVSKIVFEEYFSADPVSTTGSFTCTLDDKKYTYKVTQYFENNTLKIYTNDNNLNIDSSKYDDYNWLIDDIRKNVATRGGNCFIDDEDKN